MNIHNFIGKIMRTVNEIHLTLMIQNCTDEQLSRNVPQILTATFQLIFVHLIYRMAVENEK